MSFLITDPNFHRRCFRTCSRSLRLIISTLVLIFTIQTVTLNAKTRLLRPCYDDTSLKINEIGTSTSVYCWAHKTVQLISAQERLNSSWSSLDDHLRYLLTTRHRAREALPTTNENISNVPSKPLCLWFRAV